MSKADEPLHLPRPLWQLKEDLASHIWHRPPNHDILALTSWARQKEALEMWIELGEKGAPFK